MCVCVSFLAVKPHEGRAGMSASQIADEAAHVRRMAARIRRILAETPGGLPRGQLRNRLNSREKYLFDAAVGPLIAVGDVVTSPAAHGGTRYLHATDETARSGSGRRRHDGVPRAKVGGAS
jgi:hypothetical protein